MLSGSDCTVTLDVDQPRIFTNGFNMAILKGYCNANLQPMIDTIYIESGVRDHPRSLEICQRFPSARRIACARYGEVFNPKAQNFRLQKQRPALILAEKFKNFVQEAPAEYSIGGDKNFYFSHMLNCLYDCRYCFLQGMYQSAHYVLFVNYEDFRDEIEKVAERHSAHDVHFFSGYDCDSLALEPVTAFAREFLPRFENLSNSLLEIRTKSTQIRVLLEMTPVENVVIAFSFTPVEISNALEYKTPASERKLEAMCKLQNRGWKLGLRFDPLIFHDRYRENYQYLFAEIFREITCASLHSVSLGGFRMPQSFFSKLQKLYPDEKLFAGPLHSENGMTAYDTKLEQEMMQYCSDQILEYIPKDKFFPCSA